ncbi:toluene tolerance protein [Neisseria arctica]|uniref:Toluene tolerance protein n=1 Tax=Neisseria arctica TaxID=1470200 RepID=A0A0J0YUG9_9NEIS|nr:ABC transporter substrate-binding protein [Neisseria arctica]KLT73744.1 toluene tolerance protein [Neisseria arctica]UOO85884.1 ABC transporter substrate-binding protein [Neisseria arctica]
MNRWFNVLMVAPVAVVAPFSVAAPATQHPAQVQFKQNMDAVLAVARNKQLNDAQKIQRIERYADQYLDYERIAALAVGLPWRQFTPKQKTDFIAAFKSMMIGMYSRSALMGAVDANVEMLPKVLDSGNNRAEVFTEIRTARGNKYEVGYRLYKVGGVYKIYDIRVDGSSMVTVYRNQFNDLIKQKGIDGTIATVNARGLKKVN